MDVLYEFNKILIKRDLQGSGTTGNDFDCRWSFYQSGIKYGINTILTNHNYETRKTRNK